MILWLGPTSKVNGVLGVWFIHLHCECFSCSCPGGGSVEDRGTEGIHIEVSRSVNITL